MYISVYDCILEGILSYTELYLPSMLEEILVVPNYISPVCLQGNSLLYITVFACMPEGYLSCSELYLPVDLRNISLV